MRVKIVILSGARQGEHVDLDAEAVDVGDAPSCEVYFNPQQDPNVRGKHVALRWETDGWRIRNLGTGTVLLNHEAIERQRPIRSGDVVRMSEAGPDFSFVLLERRDELSKTPADSMATQASAASGAHGPTGWSAASSATLRQSRRLFRWGAAAAALLFVLLLAWGWAQLSGSASVAVKLPEIPDQVVNEGQPLALSVRATTSGLPEGLLTYRLDTAPAGMRIDSHSGRITWTPSEQQGPGQFQPAVRVAAHWKGRQIQDSRTFNVRVKEVNQPPVIGGISDIELDPVRDGVLGLDVPATDADVPPGRLAFSLGPGAPAGARIDATTGRLTWQPAKDQSGRKFHMVVRVTDNGTPAMSAETAFDVTVKRADPWALVAERVRPCVYLLVAEQPQSNAVFPYGTACAISEHALLTSATLAVELEKRRRAGWIVSAMKPEQRSAAQVQDIKVHWGFNQLNDSRVEQIFFDLAILTVNGALETFARLATIDELNSMQPGRVLGCVAIAHEGEPLTRFDHPVAEFVKGKIFHVSTLGQRTGAAGAGAPKLIHLRASFGRNVFGSPVVTEAGRVIAVYAERAEMPQMRGQRAATPFEIHYAPVTALVAAWQAGQGTQHWVVPRITHAEAVPSTR